MVEFQDVTKDFNLIEKSIEKNKLSEDLHSEKMKRRRRCQFRKVIAKMKPNSSRTFRDENKARLFYQTARNNNRKTKWERISPKKITIHILD